jgi:nucleoid-associated protein EbfC
MSFDMNNLGGLMANFQERIQQVKDEAAKARVEGQAGGGLVKVVASGDQQVVSVHIAEGALDDPELLEDLLVAATNDAMRLSKEHMGAALQQVTGGLPLPPGLGF